MICYGNIGVVINVKGNCEQARNVYAIDQESFKNALTISEKWYLDRGYVVCNKNYYWIYLWKYYYYCRCY